MTFNGPATAPESRTRNDPQPNIWIQPIDGLPAPLTHFTDGREVLDFAWLRDSAHLAVARVSTRSDIVLFQGIRSRQ